MSKSIEIVGTESLGVRGLSCFVKAGKRRILIDPGVALGYIRHGLLPHPLQVAEGERVRHRIIEALTEATDVVFSHFHGDHIPIREANPYQLAIRHLPVNFQNICCWSKSMDSPGEKMKQRAQDLRVRAKNFKKPRNVTVQQCPSCVCAGKRGTAETPSRLENYI